MEIIRDVHRGIEDSEHSKAMALHRGRNITYDGIDRTLFWRDVAADISEQSLNFGTM